MINENVILRQLSKEIKNIFNRYGFDPNRYPVFPGLFDNSSYNGVYYPTDNTIFLDRSFVEGNSWVVVLEILKHELAHHVAYKFFNAKDHTAHGEAFQKAADSLGLTGSARKASANSKELSKELEDEKSRILARVEKLKSMTKGTDNANEAAVALRRLSELQKKYDIEKWEKEQEISVDSLVIDFGIKRCPSWTPHIITLMMEVYKVEAVLRHVYCHRKNQENRCVEFIGTKESLEMVDYAYNYVVNQMKRAYKLYKGPRGKATANSFYKGFINSVCAKFSSEEVEKKADSTEKALVAIDKEIADNINKYKKMRFRKLSKTHFGGSYDPDANEAGSKAGDGLTFKRGVKHTETLKITG